MDYKKTLNLPRTALPMKADLAEREPGILGFWEKSDNYAKSVVDRTRPPFILHDGPPYANGDIHMGHTLNKVLKDIVVRYKNMRGYWAPYVPGWDCHGQPIDHQVEKKLGGQEVPAPEFRKLCREYALTYVDRQGEQFKRLGVRGNYKKPYLTLDREYEATIVRAFADMYSKGLIYEGLKPVYWCYRDKTALAEAEIEYEDETSPSIYVRFPLLTSFKPLAGAHEPVSIIIWTTTPWTLPANVAVSVHPDEEYSAVRTGGEILIMASQLVPVVAEETGLTNVDEITRFRGRDLKGLRLKHPILDKESEVVTAAYVTLDTGTGCVHIAPGHGEEDYIVGRENDLPTVMPVDDDGIFTDEAGKWAGKHIKDANPEIVADLAARRVLLWSGEVVHSYPHCWRCKSPVIFRATRQWFVSMEKGDMRRKALAEIGKVKWIPPVGETRIRAMVEERPDWCISRQRTWGVPLPILYCEDCDKPVVTDATLKAIEELFRREGADAWYLKEITGIVPKGTKCTGCGGFSLRKGLDILDVWFESGTSHEAVLKTRDDQRWPADLYLEGSDQHRGWFQLSLLISVGVGDAAPYRSVLTHGFTVDGEGRKMSKSLGNVINPLDLMEESGADILRLWTASGDYSNPAVAISDEIIDRVGESYRRIRNTVRFLLGNLNDFDPDKNAVPYKEMDEIDRWAMGRVQALLKSVTASYDAYRFHDALREIYAFCAIDMSAFYLDILKDRLYTFLPDSRERRSTQTALAEILKMITKMLAPVLCFTAEEIWQVMPDYYRDAESVHLSAWPEVNEEYTDKDLADKWTRLEAVRDEVLKALEAARNNKLIGNALEAKVEIYVKGSVLKLLQENEFLLPALLIVSQVSVEGAPKPPADAFASQTIKGLTVYVRKADGAKCERCWNYSSEVGKDKEHPTLCARCVRNVG
ncbi:MAG: isoleucine--tRNA ligase, partial [Actinomycetota bacterium]